MASSVIRRSWFSRPAPGAGVDYGPPTVWGAGASGTSVLIEFSEAMRASPAPPASQFRVSVDGASRGVTGAAVSGKQLTLTLASGVTAGQSVVASYTKGAVVGGRLADAARGNEFPSGVLGTVTAT
jgi:uncharacterized repeat protein (TIGR02059 family)